MRLSRGILHVLEKAVAGDFNSSTTLSRFRLQGPCTNQGILPMLCRGSPSTPWLRLVPPTMKSRRAKFHHGHRSQGQQKSLSCKFINLGRCSSPLFPVKISVSGFLLLTVPSPSTCIDLLFCLPTVHQYFHHPCCTQVLQQLHPIYHPNVGPTVPMELKIMWKVLSWLL